jgi:starch synthase
VDPATWRPVDRRHARNEVGIPPDADVIAWHGPVLFEVKGLDILIDAWLALRRERPGRRVHLVLVGSGEDADVLRRRLASLGDVHWVDRYLLDRSVIRLHLSAADVYAFPSRSEGFPVAPLEAMACGLPLVAADAPGIADILADGAASGGVVIPRGDRAALTRALARLLDTPELRVELGRRARARVESCFAPELIGKQLRAFLFEHLEGKRSSPPDALVPA